MNFRLIQFISAATFVAQLTACSSTPSDSSDPDDSSDGGASPQDQDSKDCSFGGEEPGGATEDFGECIPYAGANFSGSKSGLFTSSDDVIKITLPKTDLGGGLLKVTYTQAGPVVGSLFLDEGAEPAVPRIETTAFGPGVTDDEPGIVYYRLAGNRSYELGIQSFYLSEGYESYGVDWEYQALIDCYEGNDTQESSRRIPLNKPIKAMHHTGVVGDDTGLVSESGDDWYHFELKEEMQIQIKATLPGKDGADGANSGMLTVYEDDGETIPSCPGEGAMATNPVADTEKVETCSTSLPKGKYYVELSHFASQKSSTSVNETVHKSWDTEYELTIVAK